MIRLANIDDIPVILKLLSEVLELHAEIRPDIFASGTTKYNRSNLLDLLNDKKYLIYVYTNDLDEAIGHLICFIKENKSNNLKNIKTLYIDDLCVFENERGKHIGKDLFDYAIYKAKELGCYNVTLNFWNGNNKAIKFYENMGMKVQKYEMELLINNEKLAA